MGSSGGSSEQGPIRYAPYLEAIHRQLLNHGGDDEPALSFIDTFNQALGASPYASFTGLDANNSFFGTDYYIDNFPAVYDMFGRFMGGMDVCDLWGFFYENIIHGPEIENAVAAHAALLTDDIETETLPRYLAGMRDINCVMSSSFIIGKSIIESARVKSVNKFQADLRIRAIAEATDMWSKHLDWNQAVVNTYMELNKQYFLTKMDIDKQNVEYSAKDQMWDINLFENARGILGALGGGTPTSKMNEPSSTQKALGGAMAGAAMGSAILPGVGTAVGAVLGGIAGLFM